MLQDSKMLPDYSSYTKFLEFKILKSQEEMFEALEERHPVPFQKLLEGVKEKAKSGYDVLVTVQGDFSNGFCPKCLESMEDFDKFPEYYIHMGAASQIHNGGWVTETIFVIGTLNGKKLFS